jgi:two-component sensor histidine kinase/integral membrane sensor domain MASE1
MSTAKSFAKLPPGPARLLAEILTLTFIAIIYLVVARLSLTLASVNASATPIWPTTGYAFAAVLLFGYRVVPAIFLGALVVNAMTAGTLYTSLGIAVGNALEALVGAYIINNWAGGREAFESPWGVAKFVASSFAPATVISATVGIATLSIAGLAQWSDLGTVWVTWWMGDSAGALVITPALVLWGTAPRRAWQSRELSRSALVYLAAIAVGLLAFSPLIAEDAIRTPLAFLTILPLIWAAVRRHPRDTATTAAILSSFAVWGTISNASPVSGASLNESFLLLLAFMISVSAPSLALSAEVAERRRQEEHVDFMLHELSHRSKNLLAIVQSMANQVARRTDNFDDFFSGFSARLRALAEIHDLLIVGDWRGADIRELVRVQLVPFHDGSGTSIVASGPELRLTPKAAEQIGLALHELGTNAAKHGALSSPDGAVRLHWGLENAGTRQERLRFSWEETGGPGVKQAPRQGFGSLVITKIVPESLQGAAALDFTRDGVKWLLIVPSASVLVDGSGTAAVEFQAAPASKISTAAEQQLAGGV